MSTSVELYTFSPILVTLTCFQNHWRTFSPILMTLTNFQNRRRKTKVIILHFDLDSAEHLLFLFSCVPVCFFFSDGHNVHWAFSY